MGRGYLEHSFQLVSAVFGNISASRCCPCCSNSNGNCKKVRGYNISNYFLCSSLVYFKERFSVFCHVQSFGYRCSYRSFLCCSARRVVHRKINVIFINPKVVQAPALTSQQSSSLKSND